MFKCYRCGYEDSSEREKTSCPICGADVLVPKAGLILFLSIISYIFFTFVSFFNDKLGFLSVISIIAVIITCPLAIMEAINRKNKIRDGFKAPDYPSEVQNGSSRVPDFKFYDYVYGIQNDANVKKILLEAYEDGLNMYYNKLGETKTIDYSDITGIELHSEMEIKHSPSKSLIYGALIGAFGGPSAGIIGCLIGGTKAKERYVLELKIKDFEGTDSLYITSSKPELMSLAYDIEKKANRG